MRSDTAAARLDADRTAKPLTRIISHPPVTWCVGPGTRLIDPEYEDAEGKRHPIISLPARPTDYEECGICGYDHEYDLVSVEATAAMIKAHSE